MKKAKIVIADNEDGKGWFIYRVDYVSEDERFINGQSVGIQEGKPIEIGKFDDDHYSHDEPIECSDVAYSGVAYMGDPPPEENNKTRCSVCHA
ncbi:unnamed protein product [marine sediment metagenome]|uniref:Uncharacterized protein n=1 Tax=marine sediment metagenome TaxID=412755 RepID=X0YYH8_9ZZZZ